MHADGSGEGTLHGCACVGDVAIVCGLVGCLAGNGSGRGLECFQKFVEGVGVALGERGSMRESHGAQVAGEFGEAGASQIGVGGESGGAKGDRASVEDGVAQ